uniref:Small ribosomal subunit protein uS17m n=1 Tax=Sinocyclocheilus rhinocerous TaxID=307959 RepID=A0A673IH43_9TELE
MSTRQASVHAKWIIGQVIGAKMKIILMFSSAFLKYYNKRKTYFAHDPLEQCTVGDVVLLKALPEKRSKHVNHELAEIVYKVGQVVDPLTGKRVAGTQYLEPLTESTEVSLMGKLERLNITASSPPTAS